ncbi:MAG: hypothetical protein V5A62_11635 [Haloarculaceae archaeon]
MGRTNPTHRDALRATESQWVDYRRALRRRDREHFDALFEHARAHADAGGYRNHPEPMVAVLVAAVLEHERRLAALEQEPPETATDTGMESR